MNICFISSFIATFKCLSSTPNLSLFSKKPKNQDVFDYNMPKGVSPFRINRRTTLEINVQELKRKRPDDILRLLHTVMKENNVDKILNNRPLRHYPNHHYKRIIKQKKGFQISDNKRESYIAKHTHIDPKDDIAGLRDVHLDKILDAVDSFDKWFAKSEERRVALSNSSKNRNK